MDGDLADFRHHSRLGLQNRSRVCPVQRVSGDHQLHSQDNLHHGQNAQSSPRCGSGAFTVGGKNG